MTNTEHALQLIADERNRQINELGYTPDTALQWTKGELAQAGAYYAMTPEQREFTDAVLASLAPIKAYGGLGSSIWPFERHYFKPGNRLRELSKAGALIAAEIERLWPMRHDHIPDLVADDELTNWEAWKAAFIASAHADGILYPDFVESTDWEAVRTDYYHQGGGAVDSYKEYYYEQ